MGSVIDFLNIGIGPVRTGIFNVADVAIMVGIALLLADRYRARRAAATARNRVTFLHPGCAESSSPMGTHFEFPSGLQPNRLAFDMHY